MFAAPASHKVGRGSDGFDDNGSRREGAGQQVAVARIVKVLGCESAKGRGEGHHRIGRANDWRETVDELARQIAGERDRTADIELIERARGRAAEAYDETAVGGLRIVAGDV